MELKKYKLADIADFNKSSISKSETFKEIIYLDTSSITENVVSGTVIMNTKEAPSRAQRKVTNNTIIYSTVRPRLKHYGILSRPQNNFIVSTGFTTIDIKDLYKDKIDPRYLYLLLTQPTITDYIGNIADTAVSAYPSINPSDLSSLCFMFPDYDIQKTIADIWNNYDRKIELNRAINQNLEAMIADVMDYKFLSNVGKLPKRRIGDIALIKAGGDCPQEWSKYKTKDYQIPIYSNGTDNEGLYGYTKEPVILKRSVTVAARGTIGYCEIREGGYVPIIRLLAVTPNDIGGDVYLHQVFNRIKFKNDGSIQQQLTVPSIASIEIPYPDTSALKTFANITYPFIEKIKLNKIQIEELTKQRDKLLPLLMNGQVSVNSDLSVH